MPQSARNVARSMISHAASFLAFLCALVIHPNYRLRRLWVVFFCSLVGTALVFLAYSLAPLLAVLLLFHGILRGVGVHVISVCLVDHVVFFPAFAGRLRRSPRWDTVEGWAEDLGGDSESRTGDG